MQFFGLVRSRGITVKPSGRAKYGSNKYTAYNLILAKWLRNFADSHPYQYVTLGGANLHDIAYISWISRQLVSSIISYEQDDFRYKTANESIKFYTDKGIFIDIVKADIFDYRRRSDLAHIFFLDLTEVCAHEQHRTGFRTWFEEQVLRNGDLILITSYLGRNPGWEKVLKQFDSEFRILRKSTVDEQKILYERAHPLFVVHGALRDAGLDSEIGLKSVGFIRYFDTSAMGLYAIHCVDKAMNFLDTFDQLSYFNIKTRVWD